MRNKVIIILIFANVYFIFILIILIFHDPLKWPVVTFFRTARIFTFDTIHHTCEFAFSTLVFAVKWSEA